MRVRALDEDHDWTFGRGRNNYLRNKAARMQNIDTRLYSFLGDCFFDLTAGIDWFGLLGAKNAIAIDYAIQTTLATTEGVQGLSRDSFNPNSVTRALDAQYSVTLSDEESVDLASVVQVSSTRLLTELGDILTTEAGDPIGI